MDLRIIVFSVEDKPFRIQNLYKNLNIQGYIWKNRNGLKELKKAISKVFISNEFYISPELKSAIHPKQAIEITSYDIHIIAQLSKGALQDNLPKIFEEKQIKPSGKSSIEKRLKFLKEHFMKKVFLVFAILFASGVFTSCTDLDENIDNEPTKLETLATGGEDEYLPEEDEEEEDPANGG